MEFVVASIAPLIADLSVHVMVEPVLWSALGLLSGGNLYAAWKELTSSSEKEDPANARKSDDVADLVRGGPARRAQIRSRQSSRCVSERRDCNPSLALD